MLGLNDRLPLREKAPAQPKRNGEPAQGANQSASQASQDRAAAPTDSEAPPQTAAQTQSQQPVPLVIFAAFIGDWLLPHNLFDLVINLKTAKARGLDVPSSIGPRADEVTE